MSPVPCYVFVGSIISLNVKIPNMTAFSPFPQRVLWGYLFNFFLFFHKKFQYFLGVSIVVFEVSSPRGIKLPPKKVLYLNQLEFGTFFSRLNDMTVYFFSLYPLFFPLIDANAPGMWKSGVGGILTPLFHWNLRGFEVFFMNPPFLGWISWKPCVEVALICMS